MLKYLLIADVKVKEQQESYYKLCQYLNGLNKNHSEIFMVEFDTDKPKTYLIDIKQNDYKVIKKNSCFDGKYEKIRDLCENFIKNQANNNIVFILIDCCLVNSPLNNISFNQYYDIEYTYKVYDDIFNFVNNEGLKYKKNTNWCCFSRGDNLLGFMSRALTKEKEDVLEEYKIKNLSWYFHNEEDGKSNLEFPSSLEIAIGKIR